MVGEVLVFNAVVVVVLELFLRMVIGIVAVVNIGSNSSSGSGSFTSWTSSKFKKREVFYAVLMCRYKASIWVIII